MKSLKEKISPKNKVRFLLTIYAGIILIMNNGCHQESSKTEALENQKIQLITLDPGHFHAALVQKSMYAQISPVVHVYAPQGTEVNAHLQLIEKYNTRPDDPTAWKEEVYTGPDYLEKMFTQKAGNVVVIAGNNKKKTEYIKKSVEAGINVLADKPMAISSENFDTLKAAFASAQKNKVLLYDIMTERYEINNMIQKDLLQLTDVFGTLQKGTLEHPAVVKESVHYFFKSVSGKPLVRPAWYYDVEQEGEGLVDVTTHMVDLVQWGCFPDVTFDYKKDIQMLSAKRWPTVISPVQFKKSTLEESYPEYLKKYVYDSKLNVYANGKMNYTIKDVHSKISVVWNFEAPEGTGDTYFSLIKGTKADLIIRQGKEQQYNPVLYIEPVQLSPGYESTLKDQFKKISEKYPGVALKPASKGWEVVIPDKYKIGHEAQFAEVTKKYLQYLNAGKLPEWEVPNMLAKYYTTTQALKVATH